MQQHRVVVGGTSGWVCSAGPGAFHIDGEPEVALRLLSELGAMDESVASDTAFRRLAQVLLESDVLPRALTVAVAAEDGTLLLVSGAGVAQIPSPIGPEILSAVSVAMWSQRLVPADTVVIAGDGATVDDGSDLGARVVRGSGFLMVPDSAGVMSTTVAEHVLAGGQAAGRAPAVAERPAEPPTEVDVPSMARPVMLSPEDPLDGSGPAFAYTPPLAPADSSSPPAPLPPSQPSDTATTSVVALAAGFANFGIQPSHFDPNSDLTLDGVRITSPVSDDPAATRLPPSGDPTILGLGGAPADNASPLRTLDDLSAPQGEPVTFATSAAPGTAEGASDYLVDELPWTPRPSASVPTPDVQPPPYVAPVPPQLLLGKRCVCGHLNSPGWPTCRVCDEPLGGARLDTDERPPLGVVRFSDGQVRDLDRSIVVGRSPRPMSHDGRRECDVVVMDSADKVISRSHFELSVVDWDLRLIDRGSRNGTRLRKANHQELVLREGESSPLAPGDVILFADRSAVIHAV